MPEKIKIRYTKEKDAVSDVWRYTSHGEDFTCTVKLQYMNGKLWTTDVSSMANLTGDPRQMNGGKFYIRQDPGNSDKKEFLAALKRAHDFIFENQPQS